MTKVLKFSRCDRLPRNATGRDFVVGDLHGHRGLLEEALAQVNFKPSEDRLLSVGDLVDKGPDSLSTLSLIEEPWFHAVLGNHELMMLNCLGYYGSRVHQRKTYQSGAGEWINEALSKRPRLLSRLADKVAALPLALHVDGDVAFNVTHADFHALGECQQSLLAGDPVCTHTADEATASRFHFSAASRLDRLRLQFANLQVQLSPCPIGTLPLTYVGHSPVRDMVVHNSYVYIDQGAGGHVPHPTDVVLPTLIEHRRFANWLSGVVMSQGRPPENDPNSYRAARRHRAASSV